MLQIIAGIPIPSLAVAAFAAVIHPIRQRRIPPRYQPPVKALMAGEHLIQRSRLQHIVRPTLKIRHRGRFQALMRRLIKFAKTMFEQTDQKRSLTVCLALFQEAKISLIPGVEVLDNHGFDAKTLRELLSLVDQHRNEFEKQWHGYFT